MYCNFLGLRCLPFEDRIDTKFLYLSSSCNRLLASLEHDAHHERSVTPVFGEAGLGKTLLIRALVARLHASDHVAVVTCPRSGAVDILSEVGKGFGVTISPSEGTAQHTKRLRGQLVRNAQADHRSILIVDQFEELSKENLAAVSSLVDLCDSTGPLLSVILFARPHASNKMNEPRFAVLAQQSTRAQTIVPLNLAETQAYIEHRLTIAGSADLGMFDEGAVILIHAASKGNPRLINQLCHATLLTAYRAEARGVSEEMASSVTTEFMQQRHFAPTNLSAGQTNSESATAGLPAAEPSAARPAADRSVQSPFFLAATTESMPSLSSPGYKIPSESHGLAEPQASALTTELSDTIGRGEGLMRRLELLLTRVDAADVGSHDVGLAQDAEERLVELLEKAERACDRADRTEARLSRFAEELGDQAEIVQKRIGQMMDNLQVGETLQGEIRQTVQQATAWAAATKKEIDAQQHALDSAISDARKRETGWATQAWNDCQSRISESLEETQRVHREMTQEADDRIRRWREEREQAEANLNSQLASLENTKNELELQSETEERARLATIEAIESRLRTAMNQAAQSVTKSEEAAERHDGLARHLLVDLQEKCEQAQADALAGHHRVLQEKLETQSRLHDEIVESTEKKLSELDRRASEVVERILESSKQHAELHHALAQTTKEFDDLIDRANITKTDLMDTQCRGEDLLSDTHTATGQIESINHNVVQTLVDIGSACERVGKTREQLQNAEQVTARLGAVVDRGESIESKLDEATGKAADLRDAFIRTSAEVETKLGQIGSHSAAATHVLNRLGEANIEAHRVMEQTAKTVKEAREMAARTEHAVQLTKRLGKVIRAANEITGEMVSRTDEAKQSAETLGGHCSQANILIDSVKDSAQMLDGARQVQTDLVESIDQAQAIDAGLRSAADDAFLKQAQLETRQQSASELIETHERLTAQTRDLIPQLDQGIADARSTTEASQQLLDQFTRHGKTLHDVLDTLGRRANKLEKSLNEMTEKPSAIVAEARAQAAQLEQVCTAVGRVFAKLSKASLEAHEQTQDFHQASQTAFERLEQLRRVGYELAQSLGSTHFHAQETTAYSRTDSSTKNVPAARIANRSADGSDLMEIGTAQPRRPVGGSGGDILKTAEAPRSIENPAANSLAHQPSRELEIAGMIADAKSSDSAKT